MAENNSSAPLKTAEGAVHPHLIALRTIAEYPITAPMMNIDAANMQRIAAQAVAAQAAPAAVAEALAHDEREEFEAFMRFDTSGFSLEREGETYKEFEVATYWHFWLARAALAATPKPPATEDSSAGDLAEVVHASTYVQPVPDHCDRIVWRGQYIHLPIAQAEVQAEPVAEARVEQVSPRHKKIALELMYGDLPPGVHLLYTAPQAQPADALDRLDAERLRALGIAAGNEDEVFKRAMSAFREPNEGESSLDYLRATVDNAMAAAQEGGNAAKEA